MTNCPHCGCDLKLPKKGNPRSVPQHRRYFAMIRAALHHWPEKHDFKPFGETHLRRWLQCKAGYHKVQSIDTAGMTPEQAVSAAAAVFKTTGEHTFTKAVGTRFYVFESQSIDFDTLPHLAACALFDAVADAIKAETGLDVEKIMPPVQVRSKVQTAREQLLEASL